MIVAGRQLALDAPGLKRVARKNGEVELRWFAAPRARKLGYQPKTVRLHYDLNDEGQAMQMASRCRQLWAEMQDWLADPKRDDEPGFDESLSSLIDLYLKHPESPFHLLRTNTKRCYREWCSALDRQCGKRRVDRITGPDLRRWYRDISKPKIPNGPPRYRTAYGIVRQMMRILVNYGIELDIKPCFRLDQILGKIRFGKQDPETFSERQAMTFSQASAIVDAGLKRGTMQHRSVALGVALQFEAAQSQIDVIGEWEKIDRVRGITEGAIISHGQAWVSGICYEPIANGVLVMARSKTGVPGVIDLGDCPLYQRALAAVPETERVGPVVVDAHGIPIRRRRYAFLFRQLAADAGVPKEIKSMHGRHGAASEADDAGVNEQDIARLLQHTRPDVTRAHYIKGSLERNRRTQRARVAHRNKESA